jgi:hypothetical protein
MADDQKQAGGGEDPWAGIDADASSAADGGFEFPSFEQIDAEQIDAEEAASSIPGFEDAAVESAVPEFDALSLGANDGVFTDDAGWTGDDIVPVDVDIEPDQPPSEPPLAVFPPVEAFEPAVSGGMTEQDDADALAHLEDSGPGDSGPGHSGPGHSEEFPVFADDESASDAIAFESAVSDGEPSGDVSLIGKSTVEVGTDHSGIVPFDDWDAMAEQAAAPSEESSTAAEAAGDAFEEAFTEDAFGEPGEPLDFGLESQEFGGVEDLGGVGTVADESADMGLGATTTAAAATAAVATVAKVAAKRPPQRRSSGGGGALAAVAVLLGGVLSIPIVFALLFWVFRKDPLNIAPKIPQSLSFLLPSEFQIAGGPKAFPGASVGGPLVASRPPEPPVIDPPAAEEPMSTTPSGEPSADPATAPPAVAATAPVEPAASGEDLFPDPVKAAPISPAKPPLDTTAFDDAVASALDSTGLLLSSDEADPDRKTILRSWYLSLAKVGEEAAAVEKSALEAGHEFDPAPEGVARVIGGILADEKAAEQFDKVARMWMRSPKRTSDGVILPATLGGSKQVGPWWFSKVVVGDGDEASEVSVVSRTAPVASEGDQVVVLGLVFEPDTVWAAACRRFEPKPLGGDEEPAVPEKPKSDDLFPLE